MTRPLNAMFNLLLSITPLCKYSTNMLSSYIVTFRDVISYVLLKPKYEVFIVYLRQFDFL